MSKPSQVKCLYSGPMQVVVHSKLLVTNPVLDPAPETASTLQEDKPTALARN